MLVATHGSRNGRFRCRQSRLRRSRGSRSRDHLTKTLSTRSDDRGRRLDHPTNSGTPRLSFGEVIRHGFRTERGDGRVRSSDSRTTPERVSSGPRHRDPLGPRAFLLAKRPLLPGSTPGHFPSDMQYVAYCIIASRCPSEGRASRPSSRALLRGSSSTWQTARYKSPAARAMSSASLPPRSILAHAASGPQIDEHRPS